MPPSRMIQNHRLHEARVDGRGVDPAGAFSVEAPPAPEGIALIVLAGELDVAAAPAVRARVESCEGCRAVVFDMAEVTFADSSMLKELLRAGESLREQGGRLLLAGCPPGVRRLLDLTRTTKLFTLVENRASALRIAGE